MLVCRKGIHKYGLCKKERNLVTFFFFEPWNLTTGTVPIKLMEFLMLMTDLCVSLNQYAHDSLQNVTHWKSHVSNEKGKTDNEGHRSLQKSKTKCL